MLFIKNPNQNTILRTPVEETRAQINALVSGLPLPGATTESPRDVRPPIRRGLNRNLYRLANPNAGGGHICSRTESP